MVTDELMVTAAKRWYGELWSEGLLEVADEIVASDYNPEWIHIDKSGPEQVKYEVSYFRSAFPDLVYRILDRSIGTERVWIRYKGQGTHLGSAWGFEPTGKKATIEGVSILYFDSTGKIRDQWGAFCFYDIFEELGLVPPFGELSSFTQNYAGLTVK